MKLPMLAPTGQRRFDEEKESGFERLRKAGYGLKGPLLWLLLTIALALLAVSGWRWIWDWHDNRIIAKLLSGEDVEIDANRASSRLLFARSYYLLKRDRIEQAQLLLDQANFRADAKTRVLMLYNAANNRLRAAFDAIDKGDFDKASALVQLSKQDYTQALRLDPYAWNVKYNLDVAARLVRDLPEGAESQEPQKQGPPKDIWTDLPGVPQGEP
jgi:mxaK protein